MVWKKHYWGSQFKLPSSRVDDNEAICFPFTNSHTLTPMFSFAPAKPYSYLRSFTVKAITIKSFFLQAQWE